MYMVQSKQNENIKYNETKEIEKDDKNTEVSVYDITFDRIDGQEYSIVFGQQKNDFIHKKIVYFPIYLVVNDKCHSQIGIIEFSVNELPSVMDEEGDISTINEKNILYYSFVNHEYLKKALTGKSENTIIDEVNEVEEESEEKLDNVIENNYDKDEYNEIEEVHLDDSVFDVCTQNGFVVDDVSIFEESKFKPTAIYLPEETKSDNDKIKSEYLPTSNENWIETFMTNKNYIIHENEGGGDSFFIAIRDAFEELGKQTTIDKLRTVVQTETKEQDFKVIRDTFLETEEMLRDLSKDIKQNEATLNEYKRRIKDSSVPTHQKQELVATAKQLKESIKNLKSERNRKETFIFDEFGYMQKLDSFDKYKDYIMTSSYSADESVLSIIEDKLNIKLIVLSEKAYKEADNDHILQCNENKSSGIFNPCSYILLCHDGKKYSLISYKQRKTFSFREIPYAIKILIINKCCEKNAGSFNKIQDFKNLRSKMNIREVDEDEDMSLDMYDPSIVFQFYEKSQNKVKPGKGSGEKIKINKLIDYEKLHKKDNWRRKLDDHYGAVIEIDGHKWHSITHYYQACKYKKTHPHYYLQFSLDSNSDMSKSIDLAKEKGSQKGQDKNVKIDPDFYIRNLDDRKTALDAKFKIPEMREILQLTYPAKLVKFQRGFPPKIDRQLLMIRKEIIQ